MNFEKKLTAIKKTFLTKKTIKYEFFLLGEGFSHLNRQKR